MSLMQIRSPNNIPPCNTIKAPPVSQAGLFIYGTLDVRILVAVQFSQAGREELVDRELDFPEELTGVAGRVRRGAFLVRDAVVVNRDHHLDFALQLDDGEHTDGDVDVPSGLAGDESAVEDAVHRLGNGGGGAAAVAVGFRALADLGRQHDGVNHLYAGGGAVTGDRAVFAV